MKILEMNNAIIPLNKVLYVEQVGRFIHIYLEHISNDCGYITANFCNQEDAREGMKGLAKELQDL